MSTVNLSKAELEFLLGDSRAITGEGKIELDARFRLALRQENQKLPPRWREEVQVRIAKGEHRIFPAEAAKGVKVLPSGRTKILDKKLEKFYAAEAAGGVSALTSDDLISMMDL